MSQLRQQRVWSNMNVGELLIERRGSEGGGCRKTCDPTCIGIGTGICFGKLLSGKIRGRDVLATFVQKTQILKITQIRGFGVIWMTATRRETFGILRLKTPLISSF